MKPFRLLLWLCLLLPFSAHAQREPLSFDDLAIVQKNWPEAKRTGSGLRTEVLREGSGPLVKSGDMVSVLYVGSLLNGTVFDKKLDPKDPLKFRVDRGQVIQGWDEGLQLMRAGEKRRFIVPFELAYGTRGRPPSIPRKSTLVFEVELLSIDPK